MKIVLFGCMMQEPHVVDKIRKDYPFVDLVFGTHNIFRFAELFYEMKNGTASWWRSGKVQNRSWKNLPTERNILFQIRGKYYVRLQQFLQLLYCSLCTWTGAQPRA